MWRSLLMVLIAPAVFASARGDIPPALRAGSEQERAKLAHEFADRETGRLEITPTDANGPAQRRHVLRWSNPALGEVYGDSYLWTWKGRPVAITSIFAMHTPVETIGMEFQSLAEDALRPQRDGHPTWSPRAAGVEFRRIGDAPPVSRSRGRRLLQMRQLARSFEAEGVRTDGSNESIPLRLLTEPMYRYENTAPAHPDGAIFALVAGTDPEMLLILEARQHQDTLLWHYAAARQNHGELRLLRAGETLWQVPQIAPPWTNVTDPSRPYYNARWERFLQQSGEAVESN